LARSTRRSGCFSRETINYPSLGKITHVHDTLTKESEAIGPGTPESGVPGIFGVDYSDIEHTVILHIMDRMYPAIRKWQEQQTLRAFYNVSLGVPWIEGPKGNNMQVFEYVVVTVDEKGIITGILSGIRIITAKDAQKAHDQAIRELSTDVKLTDVEVIVRPFV
jgi:hypothetical protein